MSGVLALAVFAAYAGTGLALMYRYTARPVDGEETDN